MAGGYYSGDDSELLKRVAEFVDPSGGWSALIGKLQQQSYVNERANKVREDVIDRAGIYRGP